MHFYNALRDLGHQVNTIDRKKDIPKNINNKYQYISKIIDKIKPDIVFTIGRPELHVDLKMLKSICGKKNIFHVYWATEDRTFHDKYSLKIANDFDFIFTPANECIEDYRQMGKPAALLRYGCYPALHRSMEPVKKFKTDITIAATYHPLINDKYVKENVIGYENDGEVDLRKECINKIVMPLIDKDYNVTVWGQGWEKIIPSKYVKGYLNYESIPALYNSAKIVMGLEWDNISETKTTGRPFEVLGCKSLFLTYRTKALSNIFTDRTHLILTESKDETLEMVDYYLNNREAQIKVAEEGQREVYKKHTNYHRAARFIEILRPYL
jgi:spore maturation protein CgeB